MNEPTRELRCERLEFENVAISGFDSTARTLTVTYRKYSPMPAFTIGDLVMIGRIIEGEKPCNAPVHDERMDENVHPCRCQHCECKHMVRGADLICRWCMEDDHDDLSGESGEGEV